MSPARPRDRSRLDASSSSARRQSCAIAFAGGSGADARRSRRDSSSRLIACSCSRGPFALVSSQSSMCACLDRPRAPDPRHPSSSRRRAGAAAAATELSPLSLFFVCASSPDPCCWTHFKWLCCPCVACGAVPRCAGGRCRRLLRVHALCAAPGLAVDHDREDIESDNGKLNGS